MSGFGSRVIAGVIYVEADEPQRGTVRHTSAFLRIELAPAPPENARAKRTLARLLTGTARRHDIGVPTIEALVAAVVERAGVDPPPRT